MSILDDILRPKPGLGAYRVFGGNSGYVGYSKSKRAVNAEERGLRNKSQIDKEFTKAVNDYLIERNPTQKAIKVSDIKKNIDAINPTEWHHTSKYGNRTNYYSVEDVANFFLDEIPLTTSQLAKKEKLEQKKQKLNEEYKKIHESAMAFIIKELSPIDFKFNGEIKYYLYQLPFSNAFIAFSENDIINNRINYIFFNNKFFDVYEKPYGISDTAWINILHAVDYFANRIKEIKVSNNFKKIAKLAEDINQQRTKIELELNRL